MVFTTAKDLTGSRFGKLVVVQRAEQQRGRRAHWLCQCDCGQLAVKNSKYLLCGDTTSCGCEQKAMRARGNMKHGATPAKRTREYHLWRSMKSRCYVKSSSGFRHYGARGVTVCQRWLESFPAFLEDMGRCPQGWTLDRIDANGNYEPSNCRWAAWETQYSNKRKVLRCTLNGVPMTLAQAARASGVRYDSLHHHVRMLGESADDAVRHLRQLP